MKIREVISKLAFGKYAEIYTSMTELDKYKLNQIILYLQELNCSDTGDDDEISIERNKKI